MQMLHGDALNIAMDEGEALIGFDRIYVGASVSRSYISVLRALLKAGGILVGPGKFKVFALFYVNYALSLTTHFFLFFSCITSRRRACQNRSYQTVVGKG